MRALQDDSESAAASELEQQVDELLQDAPITAQAIATDPDIAKAAENSVQEMGLIEAGLTGFKRGRIQHNLLEGANATQFLPGGHPDVLALEGVRAELAALPTPDSDSAASFIFEAGSMIANMWDIFTSPEALGGALAGASVGAVVGAVGGPLAPATAPAGAAAGAAAGGAAGAALEIYEVSVGEGLESMRELGVPRENRPVLAAVGGLAMTALEGAGAAIILKPFGDAGKSFVRSVITKKLSEPENVALAARFLGQYGMSVLGETTTEVMQQIVTDLNANLAASLSGLEGKSLEEIADGIAETAVATLKGMTIIGPIGPGANYIAGRAEARAADMSKEKLEKVHTQAVETEMKQLSPEAFGQIVGEAMAENGTPHLYIDAEKLQGWVDAVGDPEILRRLDVDTQMADGLSTGGDIKIKSQKFAQEIAGHENYDLIADDIRERQGGMSPNEAQEYRDLGLDGEENTFVTSAIPEEDVAPVDAVMQEQGVTEAPEAVTDFMAEVKDADIYSASQFGGLSSFVILRNGRMVQVEKHDDISQQDMIQITASGAGNQSSMGVRIPQQLTKRQKSALQRATRRGRGIDNLAIQRRGDAGVRTLDVNTLPTETDGKEFVPDALIAEREMGLQAMFRTAQEAGFTEKEFERYVEDQNFKIDKAVIDIQDRALRLEQEQVTKKFKEELELAREAARESMSAAATYRSQQAVGRDRLDRTQVEVALAEISSSEQEFTLDDMPKQPGNRTIFSTKAEKIGIDVDQHAQEQGYFDGAEMILDWVTAVPFKAAVENRANEILAERGFIGLVDRQAAIIEARQALHNDTQESLLVRELNALRKARGEGRVSAKLLRRRAQRVIERMAVKDIDPKKFLDQERRLAAQSMRAFRANDLATAQTRKFQQVLQFEMARQAGKIQERVEGQRKFLNKLANMKKEARKKLPVQTQQAIDALLGKFAFTKNVPTPKDIQSLTSVERSKISPTKLTAMIKKNEREFWRNLTPDQLSDVHDTAKALQKTGQEKTKFRNQALGEQLAETVAAMVENIDTNMKAKDLAVSKRIWDKARRAGRGLGAWILNADSLLRQMDGFKDGGVIHDTIKAQTHDKALGFGYREDQVGYLQRMEDMAPKMIEVYDIYTAKERARFQKKVKGLSFSLTKEEHIAAMLMAANFEGYNALLDDPRFNELKFQEMVAVTTEKDVRFINAVIELNESFWPEIVEAEQRRNNITPERVDGVEIVTPGGTIKGGYSPLVYEDGLSIFEQVASLKELALGGQQGQFIQAQTKRWYVENRTENSGKALRLNLSTIQNHIGSVIYDLEMGDAIDDAHKAWNQPEVRQALIDKGGSHVHDAVNLWLRDVATGEIAPNFFFEQALRYLRAGFVISKLGLNLKTAAFQLFGITTSMVQLGKWRTIRSLHHAFSADTRNFIDEVSAVMRKRDLAWNQDIEVAREKLNSGLSKLGLGDNGAIFIREAAFFAIKKLQRFIDIWTWGAAYDKAMLENNNDQAKAIQFADLMVQRAQGSAQFAQRTAAERGSTTLNRPQSEFIRVFTPFLSYFIAKNNVAFERFKKTNFKSPFELANFAADMAVLYLFEAMMVTLMTSDLEDEDDSSKSKARVLAEETFEEGVLSFLAGFPGINTLISESRGFSGDPAKSAAVEAGKLAAGMQEAMETGEYDQLVKPTVNLVTQFGHLPGASQFNRSRDAIIANNEGEDVSYYEFLMGVRR
jgi:hypothetical protein